MSAQASKGKRELRPSLPLSRNEMPQHPYQNIREGQRGSQDFDPHSGKTCKPTPANGLSEEFRLPLYPAIIKHLSHSLQRWYQMRPMEIQVFTYHIFTYHIMMSSPLNCQCRPHGEPEISSLPRSTEISPSLRYQQRLNEKETWISTSTWQ